MGRAEQRALAKMDRRGIDSTEVGGRPVTRAGAAGARSAGVAARPQLAKTATTTTPTARQYANTASGGRQEDLPALLKRLAGTALKARKVALSLESQVLHLRSEGASWERIGEALGVSKQAAQQRYGKGC